MDYRLRSSTRCSMQKFAYVLLPFVCLIFSSESSNAVERPNVVLIFSDDQGYHDVGCYGSEIPTPHIDSIAENGVKFSSWYSASSICTPSRFGLLTGRNPSRSQDQLLSALMFLEGEDAIRSIKTHEDTVAEQLRTAGYTTALFGKWHLGHGRKDFLPINHGFDLFKGHTGGCIDYFTMTYGVTHDWYEGDQHVPKNGYATELITDEAIGFLESRASQDKPFFLYLPYNAPHFGKGWNPSKNETVNIMQAQAADLQRVDFIEDKIRREFAAMVVSLDDGVGQIIQALDRLNFSQNTLLIFLTDHGGDPVYGGSNVPLRGDKATLFDGGLKVPCVMSWPGKIKSGTVSNAVTSSLDLFPTLCEIAKVPVPDPCDGVSLARHLLDNTAVDDRELFWETGRHVELGRGHWQAIRSGKWKYVQMPDDSEYLFDLESDPNESTNLAEDKADLLKKLNQRAVELAEQYRKSSQPDSKR